MRNGSRLVFGLAAVLVACASKPPAEDASTAPRPSARSRLAAPESAAAHEESATDESRPSAERRSGAARDTIRFTSIDYAAIPKASDLESKGAPNVHVQIRAGMMDADEGFHLSASVDANLAAEILLPTGNIFTRGSFKSLPRSPCIRGAISAASAFGYLTSTWREESLELGWYDGEFDGTTCKIALSARVRASATAVIRGLVYAARVGKPHTDEESLWLVMPRVAFVSTAPVMDVDASGSFTKVVLPVRRGDTASVIARFPGSAATEWLSHTNPDGFGSYDDNSAIVLTLDVAWAIGVATPEASATVGGPGAGRIADPNLL